MIYNIQDKKFLVEQKLKLLRKRSNEMIMEIYGKNKFLDILFFELISNSKK